MALRLERGERDESRTLRTGAPDHGDSLSSGELLCEREMEIKKSRQDILM